MRYSETINYTQMCFLRQFLQERAVTDLGAGNLDATTSFVEWGASSVTAVDKEMPSLHEGWDRHIASKVLLRQVSFDQFHDAVDLAFVSWPVNWPCGLDRIVDGARTVVYLGKNTDGLMCGTPDLFKVLSRRSVLAYLPAKKATLIAYGDRMYLPGSRRLYGEELAGINAVAGSRMMTYEEAELEPLSTVPVL